MRPVLHQPKRRDTFAAKTLEIPEKAVEEEPKPEIRERRRRNMWPSTMEMYRRERRGRPAAGHETTHERAIGLRSLQQSSKGKRGGGRGEERQGCILHRRSGREGERNSSMCNITEVNVRQNMDFLKFASMMLNSILMVLITAENQWL